MEIVLAVVVAPPALAGGAVRMAIGDVAGAR
jgi:hypothetical protein